MGRRWDIATDLPSVPDKGLGLARDEAVGVKIGFGHKAHFNMIKLHVNMLVFGTLFEPNISDKLGFCFPSSVSFLIARGSFESPMPRGILSTPVTRSFTGFWCLVCSSLSDSVMLKTSSWSFTFASGDQGRDSQIIVTTLMARTGSWESTGYLFSLFLSATHRIPFSLAELGHVGSLSGRSFSL